MATAYQRKMAAAKVDLDRANGWLCVDVPRAEQIDDLLNDWAFEDARERAEQGYDDCPQLETCDDAGTGEGRWMGRV